MDLDRVLGHAEDWVVRSLRSGSVRDARKRRTQRRIQEAFRRFRRAGLLLAALLAALVVASILIGGIGFLTWLVAIPTSFLIALVSLLLPTRQSREAASPAPVAPLEILAVRAADGLVDRWDALPAPSLKAADAIVRRLHELEPHLAGIERDPVLAGEARRLICDHMPSLVDSWMELPASDRGTRSDSGRRFAASLELLAEEFDHLVDRCCRDQRLGFETQRRFIETRYGEALRRD